MANKSMSPFMTAEQAREAGFEFTDPEPKHCEYCGEPMEPLCIEGREGHLLWISCVPCTCDGARQAEELARKEQEERAARELEQAYARSGIKKRFLGAEVERPQLARYLNSFNDEPSVGLYITGPSRAGKSHSASALAKAFVASGYRTVLTTSIAMLDDVKASFDGDAKAGAARFSSCDVLIIDDLGKENANSWVMTTLFQIINDRYEAMKPTIITSQYTPDELCRRMSRAGERESAVAITERLKETCRLVTLPRRKSVYLVEAGLSET
ncbi:ATP-binding protein [Gordonibacter pamelaeae]|uniref:ATP-binding protein n=1 Tax=Gordonibacter pamelaeae TaxID=471189 RepID=UPI002430E7E1|nr:ATP-binding protein [Gordonibacter pamelaeae]